MARAAVRPRMLVLLVVLLGAAALCARLGAWQLDRAQVPAERADRAAAAEAAVTVPLEEVLAPQTSFGGDLLGREVSVTGTYEAGGQLVVPDRALDGRTGAIVLTPLRVDGGAVPGAVLPVARGWVASPGDAGPPPAGEVSLTGYLQASEAAGTLDPGAGTAESISTAQLVNLWGGPIYSGYLVLATSSPDQPDGPAALPPPQPRGGDGWDLRNLGYALQWWIFGLFAVLLWGRLVRDEALGEPVPGAGDAPAPPNAVGTSTGADADHAEPATLREPAGGASA